MSANPDAKSSAAICGGCERPMTRGGGCTGSEIMLVGCPYKRLPYGSERYFREPYAAEIARECHDCGVSRGRLHHQHCDMEECPRCGRQMLAHECVG